MSTTTRIALPGWWAGVVLDMDGLLVDTEPVWLVGKRIMFERYRTAYDHTDHLAVYGRDDLYTAEYFAGRFGLGHEAVEPIRLEYLALVGELFTGDQVRIRPGALELVRGLSGRVPLALASNTKRELVDIVLDRSGIGAWLDASVTSSDAEAKPSPGNYLEACRRLGVAPSAAVALEDSPAGIRAAQAAGLTCIAVPSEAGTDVSHADLVVESLLDLDLG